MAARSQYVQSCKMRTKAILVGQLRPGDMIAPDYCSTMPGRLVIAVRRSGPRVEFSWLISGLFRSGWSHADWRIEVFR